jgi:hypothetical protein
MLAKFNKTILPTDASRPFSLPREVRSHSRRFLRADYVATYHEVTPAWELKQFQNLRLFIELEMETQG